MKSSSASAVLTGCNALVIIARSFGLHLDAQQMLRNSYLSTEDIGVGALMVCAERAGLRPRGLRPGWEGLLRLARALPAIVHLHNGEFMILTRIEEESGEYRAVLQDPSCESEVWLSLDYRRFSAIWTGEVILIQRHLVVEEETQLFNLMMISMLILRERKMIGDIAISAIMMSLLALVPILFFRLTAERILPFHAVNTFVVVCLVTLVLVAFEVAFGTLRRHLLLRLTTRVDVKLSNDMFARVLALPVEYFERTPAGLTMHKMVQIGRVRTFLVGQLFGTVLDGGILLLFMPVMFFISPVLTAVVLIFAALTGAWLILMLPAYRRRSGAVEAAEAARGAFLSQSIQGIRTVKSLALEARQVQEWDALTARIARLKFEEGNLSNVIQMVITPLERLLVTGTYGVGVYMALRSADAALVSTLFTFMLLSQRLAAPLIQASQLINQYDEARTAIAVVGSLVNQPPEEGRSGEGVRNPLQGHVEFSKVLFQYKGALRPALKEVSFEIPMGTTLGVMGRSGSGKTTVTRLIQRLHSDYNGLIKIDGVDVRQYDLSHLRSSLGIVLQENFLFSGTIRSNITIAKPDATFADMVHAARMAGAEEFIEKLPAGYETYVYEGSPNLSGGQRQRLAIARALITDPRILILDEATSALDAESEAIVNANIDQIARGRTVITISHRLASLVKADAILVMEQGEVNDIGKHHELLERNEIYANLWWTQNQHVAGGPPTAPARPQLAYRGPQNVA